MSVTTLLGDNQYEIDSYLNRLYKQFSADGQVSTIRLDGEEQSADNIIQAITAVNLFSERQFFIVRNLSRSGIDIDRLSLLLESPPEQTEIVLLEPSLDKRSSIAKLLKSKTDFKQLDKKPGATLINWLVDLAKQQGGSLSPADAKYLIDTVGENQLRLSSEIDKLCLYDPNISRPSIDLLVTPSLEESSFNLIEALVKKDNKRALMLYEKLRLNGEEVQPLIGLIAWQLHLLAIAKTSNKTPMAVASDLKMSSNPVSKAAQAARQISLYEIKQAVKRLLEIDSKMKQQALNADDALKYFIISF